MGIIVTLIFALLIGILARYIYPGKVQLNWIESVGLGLGGGLVGKFLAFLLGLGFSGGLITALIGALILIFVYQKWIK